MSVSNVSVFSCCHSYVASGSRCDSVLLLCSVLSSLPAKQHLVIAFSFCCCDGADDEVTKKMESVKELESMIEELEGASQRLQEYVSKMQKETTEEDSSAAWKKREQARSLSVGRSVCLGPSHPVVLHWAFMNTGTRPREPEAKVPHQAPDAQTELHAVGPGPPPGPTRPPRCNLLRLAGL